MQNAGGPSTSVNTVLEVLPDPVISQTKPLTLAIEISEPKIKQEN